MLTCTLKAHWLSEKKKTLLRDTVITLCSASFTSLYKEFLRTRATKTLALEQSYTLQGYNYASRNTTSAAFNSDLKISL